MNKQQKDELRRLDALLAKRRVVVNQEKATPRRDTDTAPEVVGGEGQLSLLGKEDAC